MKSLIDGDVLRYRIGFACETAIYSLTIVGEEEWGPRVSFTKKKDMKEWAEEHGLVEKEDYNISTRVVPDPIAHCLHSVKLQMDSIIKGSGADGYTVYLSGETNFRDRIATIRKYKGNRPTKKPFHYENIGKYLIEKWGAVVIEGEEADDALSYTQWEIINARD